MNATVSFATNDEMIVGVAGSLERLDAEPTCLDRALDDLEPVALHQFVVAGDVIRVGVRRQQVRDLEPLALDGLVQRLERCAAVDEDGRSAGPVGEQVRIREPLRVHASFDQHDRTVTHRKDRRARGLLSHAEGVPLVITGRFGGS